MHHSQPTPHSPTIMSLLCPPNAACLSIIIPKLQLCVAWPAHLRWLSKQGSLHVTHTHTRHTHHQISSRLRHRLKAPDPPHPQWQFTPFCMFMEWTQIIPPLCGLLVPTGICYSGCETLLSHSHFSIDEKTREMSALYWRTAEGKIQLFWVIHLEHDIIVRYSLNDLFFRNTISLQLFHIVFSKTEPLLYCTFIGVSKIHSWF